MTFAKCIAEAVKGGELGRDDGDRLVRDFERLKAKHERDGPGIADERARAELVAALKAENAQKRRVAKLSLKTLSRLSADLASHRNAAGARDVAGAARLTLENYDEAKFASVTQRTGTIIGTAHSMMQDLLHHFRRGAFGGDKTRWNAAQLDNVLREALGEDTGDVAAKGFAQAWLDTADWLRRRFNAAGGAIGKLERWGMQQTHDAVALRKAGREPWKAFIRPRLDLARMRDGLTGKPIDPRKIDGILDRIYESVTTGGDIDIEPTMQAAGKGALANRRGEHRFLIFRDADGWLEYHREFGDGDIFHGMMNHISGMAKDIAAMEVLGPNPAGTIEWMKQVVKKDMARQGLPPAKAEPKINSIETLWKSVRGDLATPVSSTMAEGFGLARTLVTASTLGGAAITSVTDVGTGMVARAFAGMPAGGTVKQLIQAMTPAERREAVAAGLILDSALNTFHQHARYAGLTGGGEMAQYVADRVLTVSGLIPFTQAGKHAFGLAFMSEAARHAARGFNEMPARLRATFARHGMTERDWDLIRKAGLHQKWDGTQILRPNEIRARVDDQLADKYLAMIQAETEYAVPTGGHRAQRAVLGQTRPGTISGELLRNFMQFKSFPIAFLFLHGGRVLREWQAGRRMTAAAYASGIALSTTMFGALAIQAKQVAAGKDPRDMNDKTFWGAAMLQGGALGIYGDFMFSDLNRFGGGIGSTIAGPLADRANQLLNLTLGNAVQLMQGEDTKFGRELTRFVRYNVPGSNIWYLQMAWNRVFMDMAQWMADPEAADAFRRQQRNMLRDTGQEYWWQPGSASPTRAPDLGVAIGP